MFKKSLSLALVLIFTLSLFSFAAFAVEPVIQVLIDGKAQTFDVPPQIINGRTMVPLRAIFEAMGATVQWNESTQTVTATKGDAVVVLTVGSVSPTVNGQVVPLDQPGAIVDGRTLAPLRFVGEAFGGTVDWSEATGTVTILSGSAAAPPQAGASVSITDVMGRTVTLPKPAAKLVGTHNPTLNIAIILGGGGKYLVGFGNKNMAGGLYGYVYPEIDDVLQIGRGREINMESVVQAGADLAILPQRFADLAESFEAVGVPAAVILPNSESFETIKASIALLGTLTGEEDRAAQINRFFDGKISEAKAVAQKVTDKPKALFLGASSQLSVANGLMLQSEILETVGAVNAAKNVGGSGDFQEVSVEEIIGWNPDVIYIPAYAQYTVDDLLNDRAWGSIKAVKDKRVYVFPSALEPWDYPTPSAAIGLVWLLHNLYPELYSMDQVLKDANEYYNMIYGQTFTLEQLGLK
ncbi:MAG: stalk domain-containing protein [Clostridiales bacterium]|nr:stalk domain-containing protein [Clostridiales bacterium]